MKIMTMFQFKRNFVVLVMTLLILLLMPGHMYGAAKRKRDKTQDDFFRQKVYALKELSQKASKRLADLTDYSSFYRDYVKNILRVRVPGTVGHKEVREFIIRKLKEYGWTVERDDFTEVTPLGPKNFTSIVATLNPEAHKRLALAAHYDSKLLEPKNGKYFLAATDSAIPCAMLLDFAKMLNEKWDKKKKSKIQSDVSPMLIFLDGEEAFEEWTKTDSIYGARHLASVFQQQTHHEGRYSTSINMLQALDAFVLLDLIGYKNPQFFDLYDSTSPLYQGLQRIERQLHSRGVIDNDRPYFVGKPYSPISIEDDHVPFRDKGVNILHLISIPFPKVWHTLDDDETALDGRSIENLLKIFRHFLLEYFHLD